MPADRPTASELIQTVQEFLEALRPFMSGYGGFQVRVAANLLAIAQRELEFGESLAREQQRRLRELLGKDGGCEELEAELVAWIREGDLGAKREAVLRHLHQTAEDKLRITNPKYLERS